MITFTNDKPENEEWIAKALKFRIFKTLINKILSMKHVAEAGSSPPRRRVGEVIAP